MHDAVYRLRQSCRAVYKGESKGLYMANFDFEKNTQAHTEKQERSDTLGIQSIFKARTGFAKGWRLLIAIVVLIVPLLVISAYNAASGLSKESEAQDLYQTSSQHEYALASAKASQPLQQASPLPQASPSSPTTSPFSSIPVPSQTPSSSTSASTPTPSAPPVPHPPPEPPVAHTPSIDNLPDEPVAIIEVSDEDNENDVSPEENLTSVQTEELPNEESDQNSIVKSDKVAYITIDDGPSRAITPGVLDVLKQENIKATFFVLPHTGVEDLYQRIIDEGHELGNHSYSHVYSELYKPKNIQAFTDDVMLARDYILDNYDYLTTSYRFPGGAMSRKSSIITPRREILAELGYRDFDWNIDTGDAHPDQKDKSAEALALNVLDNTKDRSQLIILMHDSTGKATTLEALPLIIAGLREQGYTLDILRNY